MHKYSSRLEYSIILGGAPETVFPKIGIKPEQGCGCDYMETLQNRLDSFAGEWHEKWSLTEAKSETNCCTPSEVYQVLNSYGRPPEEDTVLLEVKFKNKRYLHELITEFSNAFGVEVKSLDNRLRG